MHPSLALQVAERELREESEQLPQDYSPPPPIFIHFAPRWHQKRRTMTGVLAGYFDLPPRNPPISVIPDAQTRFARTAAPVVSEEERRKISKDRKRKETSSGKRKSHGMPKARRHEADNSNGVIVAGPSMQRDQSLSRFDSPLTDIRVMSEDSTPPLTPMSSGSSQFAAKDDIRPSFSKKKFSAKHSHHRKSTKDENTEVRRGSSVPGSNPTIARSDNKKRKRSEAEVALKKQEDAEEEENRKERRKSKPGWKGWVEVEGSPEPRTKLINLDFPIQLLEKRTRSGRVGPTTRADYGRRNTSTKSPSVLPDTPLPDIPLGSADGNSGWEDAKDQV